MDNGPESILDRAHVTNHCLLVEDRDQLVLVDTGFGLRDVHDPKSRLSSFFLTLNAPAFREELTAIRQIEALGFDPRDVRHIVLTHLDFDHAGGLDDFPWATVHMMEKERDYALQQVTWLDRQRFRPQQWGTRKNWKVYQSGEGDNWYGFEKIHALDGISTDIAMIPLRGHTFGHAGIAVNSGPFWMLNAGDAYFYREEMNPKDPYCTPGMNAYQLMMDKDHRSRVWNQKRLRDLRRYHSDSVKIFCAHDPVEFARCAGHAPEIIPGRKHQLHVVAEDRRV